MTDEGPLFEPGSVTHGVLLRPVFLLGGMRALLMQLADPKVAAGVADHSDFVQRLFPRLRHTLDLMAVVGLGRPEEALEAVRYFHRVHVPVRGALPDGTPYRADDPELTRWVFATLIDTVLVVEERYVGEFDPVARRRYYDEALVMARALGIPDMPPDLESFLAYVNRRLGSLEVTDTARRLARHVVEPRLGRLPPLVFAPLEPVTADLLPDRLGDAYGLRISPAGRRRLQRLQCLSRRFLPRLPWWVRTFPILHPVAGIRYRVGRLVARARPSISELGTLVEMEEARTKQRKRRLGIRGIWRLILGVIGVIAVAQELRKPPDQRTWHGKVGDLVPYDFRMPTVERFRDTYWNPEGPIISGKAWGVGWAPNLGAIKGLVGK